MELQNSRRKFIKQNSLLILGIFTLAAAACNITKEQHSTSKSLNNNRIGKISLKQLRDSYKGYLFNEFLPNMDSLVIDHQYGGFMCNVDIESRKLLSTDKQAWFEGRGIWVYSFLYNNFEKNPHYLDIARKSKDFIMKHQPTDDDFWISTFNKQGAPTSGIGNIYGKQFGVPTSAKGDIYGNMFIAEGLAEYAKASGEAQYYTIAKELILNCLAKYDKADYSYHVNYLKPELFNIPGSRVLGHWMIFLRTATQFLEHKPDLEIEALANRCVDAIMNHHLNQEYGVFNEVLNHDMSRPFDEFANFAYLGHGIEILWMVMHEAIRKKRQ